MIDDVQGRSLPRHTSPIAERDAFVIFDEARCRGADLKLQQQAMGLLTLAPGVCKDKLMQAAGRMRQLGRGQTLRIVGLSDVRDKIIAANTQLGRSSSCVSMVHVLQWVMSNTVEATLHGVTQWAAQGLHFAVTHNAPNRALQQDMLLPKDLYGSSRACRPVADVVSDMIKQQLLLISDSKVTMAVESTVDCPAENVRVDRGIAAAVLGHGQQQLLLQIQHNAGTFGAGHCITAGTAVDQECERELEREEEEELEQQIEVARATPAAEQDWDYACVAKYGSLHSISKHCRLFRMQDVLLMTQPESIRHIVWSPRVFVTSNYIWATASAQWAYNVNAVRPGSLAAAVVTSGVHTTSIGEYLRPVSNLLLLPCGGVILLSEREAEGILEQLYVNARSQHSAPADAATNKPADLPQGAHLLSLCYIRLAKHCSNLSSTRSSSTGLKQGVQLLAIPLSKSPCNRSSSNMFWQQLPAIPELVSVHLFNGGAMYDGDQQQLSHLKMMVQGRTEAVEALLDIRGKHALFPRSQLELACDVL